MKLVLKNGLMACDLACNPYCAGFEKEGCLMFNNTLTFKSARARFMGGQITMVDKNTLPQGAWEQVDVLFLDEMPVPTHYVGEKVH